MIWARLADEVRLAQFVVRAGMPPTPEFDQLMAWLLFNTGDHDWACMYSENTNNNMEIVAVLRFIKGPILGEELMLNEHPCPEKSPRGQ